MKLSSFRQARRPSTLFAALTLIVGALTQADCGSSANQGFQQDDAGADVSVGTGPGLPGALGGGDASFGPLTLDPSSPVVDVTIADGVVTSNPDVPLHARTAGGTDVPARWSVDRAELGSINPSSGIYKASASLGGTATVTATAGDQTLHLTIKVRVHVTQNGAPAAGGGAASDGGVGGIAGAGGVGGEGSGGRVNDPVLVGRLRTDAGTPGDLAMLYPYDGTVWPRGLLAPLLQWSTASKMSAVRIQLTEEDFDFDGVYSVDGLPDVARQRQPIDAAAWTMATLSNQGDALVATVKTYDPTSDAVKGPMTEHWSISPASLKGTIYYNSYNTRLAQSSAIGAILALHVGADRPVIAIPSTAGKCVGCHSLSADGSYIFAQDDSYANGASYVLPSGQVTASYAKGGDDDRKFVWAGVYPDGSFALTNSRHGREHNSIDSQIFNRASGSAIATSGFADAIKSAVTPSFAGDGRRVAFNFWEGAGTGGVTNGSGHSLAIMDFDCHAAAGATTCGAPPYAFSNLREIYRDSARFPGWPGFTPDNASLVFHNTIQVGGGGDGELTTWQGAQAEIWSASVPSTSAPGSAAPLPLAALNGVSPSGVSYLPRLPQHPRDEILNYEPTVGPIASGGYVWVVFTSRRAYGNVAAGDPYETGDGSHPTSKKLWVAALDLSPKPGVDSSHPAFYLPGQELNAGNMRGFWAADPCAKNGQGCGTGDECCGGYCHPDQDGGALVCADTPQGCAQTFEKCASVNDCCDSPQVTACVGGRCTPRGPK